MKVLGRNIYTATVLIKIYSAIVSHSSGSDPRPCLLMPYSHLTPQEAGAILAAHLPEPPTELPSVSLVDSTDADLAAGASFQVYLVHTTPHPTTYFLTLQFSEPLIGEAPLITPNSIRAQYNLLS